MRSTYWNDIQQQNVATSQQIKEESSLSPTHDNHSFSNPKQDFPRTFQCYTCSKILESRDARRSHVLEQHPVSYGGWVISKLHNQYHQTRKPNSGSVVFMTRTVSKVFEALKGNSLLTPSIATQFFDKIPEKEVAINIKERLMRVMSNIGEPITDMKRQEDTLINWEHSKKIRKTREKMPSKVNKIEVLEKPRMRKRVSSKTNSCCHICGRTFQTNTTLQSHIYEVHEKRPRKHECDVCHKKFRKFASLAEHKFIHSEERLFICGVCGKAFKTNASLRQHNLGHKELKHQCVVCNKKFRTSSHMRQHLVSHTGATPYKCKECESNFSNTASLRRHRIQEH